MYFLKKITDWVVKNAPINFLHLKRQRVENKGVGRYRSYECKQKESRNGISSLDKIEIKATHIGKCTKAII